MNNLWNKTNAIAAIVAIFVTIFITWYFNREKETSLNIEEVNSTLLTQNLNVEGLSAYYLYHDSIEVTNLWRTLFVIKNTGEQSLYGKGFSEMNVQNGIIPLNISGCNRLLSMRMKANNNGTILDKYGTLIVTQWKPNEYIEIEVLTEGDKSPRLEINARGIKDASVSYSKYTPSVMTVEPKIIDSFPNSIKSIIKWIIIVVMGILILASVFQIHTQLRDKPTPVKFLILILMIIILAITISPILWMF